jgi:hypothetical protein
MSCSTNSLFGIPDKYIKFLGGDAVAIEGSNTIDRQILNTLRFPYTQLLRGRVVLKPGQINYLMNFLGLGDNATFLSIAAKYDSNSKIEADNYVQFNYYPDLSKNFYFAQMLLLTGNSTNRVPQLYLTNPNANYAVTLDILVANIDDTYNYFNDVVNQSGLSFTSLAYTDIETYVPDHSIVVLDIDRNPLAYIGITSITSIYRTGLIVTIQETTLGKIFLEFINDYNAKQAYSMLNYIWHNVGANPPVIIDSNHIYVDNIPPAVYFNLTVGATASGATISMTGATMSGPYDTSMGTNFSTTLILVDYGTLVPTPTVGTGSVALSDLLISKVEDNKDGLIGIDNTNIILKDNNLSRVNSITTTGTYSMSFNISDYAGNSIDTNTSVVLTVI